MHKIIISPTKLLAEGAVAEFLRRKSLRVMRASSKAGDVLDIARTEKPSLIIFSDEISDMTVKQFCEEVRNDALLSRVRLLMLTEQFGADIEEIARLDSDAHFLFPLDEEQIIATIGALLEIGVRSSPRVPVEIIAGMEGVCKHEEDGRSIVVNIVDMSETGMRVESPVFLELGAVGNVRFRLPGTLEVFSLECQVMLMANEILMQYGVELRKLSAEEREAIRGMIEKRLAE